MASKALKMPAVHKFYQIERYIGFKILALEDRVNNVIEVTAIAYIC